MDEISICMHYPKLVRTTISKVIVENKQLSKLCVLFEEKRSYKRMLSESWLCEYDLSLT